MSPSEPTKKILIVDDDQGIRRVLSESLRLLGYETTPLSSAEEAIDELQQTTFDLALLDINLPGLNGLQLCKHIRSRPQNNSFPVIMMTAYYKDADHIREARETYGANDYLLKPFPLKALHEKIAEQLGASPSEDTSARLSVAGDLVRSPLPNLLHNLYELSATGLLHLEHRNLKKIVYIRNGYPIFVRSNVVSEFLGQILLRKKILTAGELEQSLAVAKDRKQRHGMALVEMGLLAPQELDNILHEQIVEKLLEAFSWEDGQYRFVQAREFKQNVTRIDISPANLILRGLRDYAPRTTLLKKLEPHQNKYPRFSPNPLYRFQEIKLSTTEQRILDSCNGTVTLREVLDKFTLSRSAAEPLLAALLTTGIIIATEESQASDPELGAEDAGEEKTKRHIFLKEYAWMMEQDYFSLLNVKETDSPNLVRKSYYKLVKKYHPDRFFEQEILLDLKDKVHALFQRISEAHETLSDPKAKAHYQEVLSGTAAAPKTSLESILEAEKEYHKGIVLLRVNKFTDAQQAFSEALKLSPDENEYVMYHAWASYKSNVDVAEITTRARNTIEKVMQQAPKLSKGHLFLGYINKSQGNNREAKRHFEKTIQLDPNCTEALRELRLMYARQEKEGKERKGFLGKFRRS